MNQKTEKILKRRTTVIFGSNGRIGRAVAEALAQSASPAHTISWRDAKSKLARDQRAIVARLTGIKGEIDIVFASGLTDPSASAPHLALANVEQPVGLIEATIDYEQFRYLTIGSVLETFSPLTAGNRYLASKKALWERVN